MEALSNGQQRSQVFTPTDTLFWGFVMDNVYVPPLPMALKGLKHRSQQPVPKLMTLFFADYGRRLHTGLALFEQLRAVTFNFTSLP
jgi:hypothetical protein